MYFDLHLHPSTKAMFAVDPATGKNPDCWKQLEIRVVIALDESPLVGSDRIDSQASLKQIKEGNIRVGIFPLHALEIPFARASFMKQLEQTAEVVGPLEFDRSFPKNIREKKPGYGFFDLLKKELGLLVNSLNGNFRFINDAATPISNGTVHAFLSVEGGHSFLNGEDVDNFPQTDEAIANVLQRFDELYDSVSTHGGRIVYQTLTHIGRSPFCAQAFAFAMNNTRKIPDDFMPRDAAPVGVPQAIRKVGWALIEKCLAKGILMDIKHMSYRSRCEYYWYVYKQRQEGNHIPVMATHMGAAGYSFKKAQDKWVEWPNTHQPNAVKIEIPRPKGLLKTQFYPITLNLYDEEIKFIVESEGLIGISLDERVIGYKRIMPANDTDKRLDYDFYAPLDYIALQQMGIVNFTDHMEMDFPQKPHYRSKPGVDETPWQNRSEEHLYFYCNNLLRFVYAGGPNTWKHICIGSDFDGLVDAIECCKTSAELPLFRLNLKAPLKKMILSVDNPEAMFHVNMNDLDNDLETKLDDLFFNNGHRFLNRYFSGPPSPFC